MAEAQAGTTRRRTGPWLALALAGGLIAQTQAQPASDRSTFTFGGATFLAQPTDTREKLVIQVSDNDPAKWNLALNNARNVQTDLGEGKTEIEIVVYGPGIGMLKSNSPVAKRIDTALADGIKVVACENTLAAQKLTRADMLPKIGYVPAGVVQLMKRQQQGYAYIRP